MRVSSREAKDLLMKWSSEATPLRGAFVDQVSGIRARFRGCKVEVSGEILKLSSESFDWLISLLNASFEFFDKLEAADPEAMGESFVYSIGIVFPSYTQIGLYEYDVDKS